MPNSSTDIILRNGRPVMREYYDAIRFQVESALTELEPDFKYTTRQICGEAFWRLLGTAGLRQQAGRCLAHLVAAGGIGLAFAPSKRRFPRQYHLRISAAARGIATDLQCPDQKRCIECCDTDVPSVDIEVAST